MVRRIRTGVVGLGHFGSFHVRHHAAHPEIELVALADVDDAKGKIAAFHGAAFHRDYRDLFGQVDAVSIAVPTSMHHAVAREFIDAGIHVLVEKPLADGKETAADLVARARQNNVVLQVGHVERFSPTYRALRGEVRRPVLIECQRHAPWTGRITDADVVLDLMIHDIDLALDLAGSRVESIEAAGSAIMGHDLDAVNARLTFQNGCVAEISASRVAPVAARSIRVVEHDRAITADLIGRTVNLFRCESGTGRPLATHVEVGKGDALGSEIAAFVEAVTVNGRDGVDGQAGVDALAVAEDIRKRVVRRPVLTVVAAGAAVAR